MRAELASRLRGLVADTRKRPHRQRKHVGFLLFKWLFSLLTFVNWLVFASLVRFSEGGGGGLGS